MEENYNSKELLESRDFKGQRTYGNKKPAPLDDCIDQGG